MEHLNAATLARLVDEPARPEEAAHLAGCGACRAELQAMVAQTRELAGLMDLEPDPAALASLRDRLRREGLIRAPRRATPWRLPAPALRAAAAVALFIAGGATGLLLRRDAPVDPAAGTHIAQSRPIDRVEEAEQALRAAEASYLAAMIRYAELTGGGSERDAVARLAALEGIVLTTRAALRQAPADPVINGYHLAAVAQRDAMLQQIATDDDDNWF
jgi:hypothetical protein